MATSKEQQEMMQWMRDDPFGFSAKMRQTYPTATEEQIARLFTKVGMKPPTQYPEIPVQGDPSSSVDKPEGPLPPGYSKDAAGNVVYTGLTHSPIPITDAAPLVGTVKSGSVPAPQRTDDQILTEKMRK